MVFFCGNWYPFIIWPGSSIYLHGACRWWFKTQHDYYMFFGDAVLGVKSFLPMVSVSCCGCIFWYFLFFMGALKGRNTSQLQALVQFIFVWLRDEQPRKVYTTVS